MYSLLIIFHVIICLLLIVFVLVQHGKGAEMGAAFGGGSSNTMFGSQGATPFLVKVTTCLAALFFISCVVLSHFAIDQGQQQAQVSILKTDQGQKK